jgi:hypothetical protein
MKKLILIIIILAAFWGTMNLTPMNAATYDYLSFEDLFYTDGKMIHDWTEEEYRENLKSVSDSRAFGWKAKVVQTRLRVDYVVSTKMSLYNEGTTPIVQEFTYEDKVTVKHGVSVKGELSYNNTNKGKELTKGLSAAVKTEYNFNFEETEKINFSLKFSVDPGTYATIQLAGVGWITNGVADYRFFWARTDHGAWEIFSSSGESFKFIKKRI